MTRFGLSAFLLMSLASCDSGNDPGGETVEVTLLVVYTVAAAGQAGDIVARLDEVVEETNETYVNSDVDLRLRTVHEAVVDYVLTDRLQDLERLVRTDDGFLDSVHGLRDEHEADIVALITHERSATINAAIMADERTAFVMVYWGTAGAPDWGLAHEIGHLFGARHSADADPATEPFPYGHGFRDEEYRTIMANGPQERVPYYSGPDRRHDGVILGDPVSSDVARVLREAAPFVASFRGERWPTSFVPAGTWPTVSID